MNKFIPPTSDDSLVIPSNVNKYIKKYLYRIILVIGGAGFGKTSLLTQLYHLNNNRKIWYNIDNDDSNITYFIDNIYDFLKKQFNVRRKRNEEKVSYIIRILNKCFENGTIYFDNIYLLGPDSENTLYKIIENTPLVNSVLSSRTTPSSQIKDIIYDKDSIVISEKELNFSIQDIQNILKIFKINKRYAKFIFEQAEGYPLASKLMIYNYKQNKDIKFKIGIKIEIHFDLILNKFDPNIRKIIIMSAILPDSIFFNVVKYIVEFPTVRDLRNKGVPIVIFRDSFKYHISFNNFLKRKAQEIKESDLNDFLIKIVSKVKNKYDKLVLYFIMKNYEKLEKDISTIEFSKLYKSSFGDLYVINTGDLDKNIFLNDIIKFPYLLVFFTFLFIQEVNQTTISNITIRIVLESLKKNYKNYKDDWLPIISTLIIAFEWVENNFESVMKYGTMLEKTKHNRDIAAIGIANSGQAFAQSGQIQKAERMWTLSREWGEKYNSPFAIINSLSFHSEFLMYCKEDYESAYLLVTEGIDYSLKINAPNAIFYFYNLAIKYHNYKNELKKSLYYADQSLEIAEYHQIDEWKKIVYTSFFEIYKHLSDFKKMKWAYNNIFKYCNSNEDRGNINFPTLRMYNSEIYYKKGNLKSAYKLIEEAEEYCRNNPVNDKLLADILLDESKILIDLKKISKAQKSLSKMIEIETKLTNWRKVILGEYLLTTISKNKNEHLKHIFNFINKEDLWYILDNEYINLLYDAYSANIEIKRIGDILKRMNKFKSVLLLGNAKLIIAGNETNINNKIPMELLVLLIRNYKKIVTRDQLIEWLYPDYVNNCGLEKAKINLRKTISRLNKLFGKKYISSIPSHDGGYIIDLEEDFTVDLIDYKNLVSEGLKNNDKSILKKAINMYRGPLLENFRYVNDEIQDYRIDLHDKMISICNKLMEYYILKNNKASIYELEEKIESIKNTI